VKPAHWQPLARGDIDDAAARYGEQGGPSLELAFIEALELAIGTIATHPGIGSSRLAVLLKIHDLRVWPLKDFPSLIFMVAVLPALGKGNPNASVVGSIHDALSVDYWAIGRPSLALPRKIVVCDRQSAWGEFPHFFCLEGEELSMVSSSHSEWTDQAHPLVAPPASRIPKP
jgi:toxin ParE1/3/4